MTIEFQLARAFTAQAKWNDPKHIRGGKPELTADDIRAAVCMTLTDHPFAFHALMAKYCDDSISAVCLHDGLHEHGLLLFHEAYPERVIAGDKHSKLVTCAIDVFYEPAIFANMTRAEYDSSIANGMGVHPGTYQTKYREHFQKLSGLLLEMELVARDDYRRIMSTNV